LPWHKTCCSFKLKTDGFTCLSSQKPEKCLKRKNNAKHYITKKLRS
jgi:hypothetical protein